MRHEGSVQTLAACTTGSAEGPNSLNKPARLLPCQRKADQESPLPPVVIENPILNSPYQEPRRHFKFSDDGITDEIIEERRVSSYFVPIPRPKNIGKAGQLALGPEWTQDRVKENEFINRVRGEVTKWRLGGYQGITPITRRLLDYWQNPERERQLFFCQIEAV